MALYHRLVELKNVLKRKREQSELLLGTGRFQRCLTRWDLTSLGLGNTLGVGVYVLIGAVAVRVAGPSIILSFLIAAVASILAGLCYAEFGSRVPRAGSAYLYAYVCVGEFVAFMFGWNMILEAIFGSASIAKAMSTYLDVLTTFAMSELFFQIAPLPNAPFIAPFFDFFAFGVVILLAVALVFGARQSRILNNICAILNIINISFIIITGAINVSFHNWNLAKDEIVDLEFDPGVGGFFPYGIWGTLKGAAVCFYGFAGFDIITSTGDEVKDPQRIIPHAVMTVLGVALFMYLGVAAVVTLMVPYYTLDRVAAVATSYEVIGWEWAKYVVASGATLGIFSSLFGSMFPLPRLLYSMARDHLMPPFFKLRFKKSPNPYISTLVPACVIGLLAGFIDMELMVLMMCVGTLFSYTAVGACIIVLRYRSQEASTVSFWKQLIGMGSRTHHCRISSRCANIALALFIITTTASGVLMKTYPIVSAGLHVLIILWVVIMALQPQDIAHLPPFKTHFVPFLPCISMYLNINLMIFLNIQTWVVRIIVWIIVGIIVYVLFLYLFKKNRSHAFHIPDPEEISSRTHHHGHHHHHHHHKPNKPTSSKLTEDQNAMENGGAKINPENKNDNTQPPGTNPPEPKPTGIQTPEKRPSVPSNQPKDQDIITLENDMITELVTTENELQQKEAKIIDLLDQVLQAEEENYTEVISLKEEEYTKVDVELNPQSEIVNPIPHRKSLSELSDAGSDASFVQVLSKYDVIAQVHREDLPKLNEDIEKEANILNTIIDEETKESNIFDSVENLQDEDVTAFNNSETNSRTDESGYSDTIDRSALNDSTEDTREDIPYIPEPPPFDENYFSLPYFQKCYTIPARPKRQISLEQEEEEKPRESVQSNNSQDDGNITFGSKKQVNFMSKLNTIYKNKIEGKEPEKLKRSRSTGDVLVASKDAVTQRPAIFLDMQKELLANHLNSKLRPVKVPIDIENTEKQTEENVEVGQDLSMSREDLKSKLETIFATGGPKLLKPRLMKSNPPTPEDAYLSDASSPESIVKVPKMEKNDTLKRQKDKFNEVLNSFRLSINKEDVL